MIQRLAPTNRSITGHQDDARTNRAIHDVVRNFLQAGTNRFTTEAETTWYFAIIASCIPQTSLGWQRAIHFSKLAATEFP
jgi:hypothetical protein